MAVLLSLLLSLALGGLEQSKPDFSGKWTKIPTTPGEPVETMTISQTAEALTVETDSRAGLVRWTQKLDGSESRNVVRGEKGKESIQVSRSTWDGDSLVTRTPVPAGTPPFMLTTAMRLEGPTLVIQATSKSDATGAILNEATFKYSKTTAK